MAAILQDIEGRDRVLRTIQYACVFASAFSSRSKEFAATSRVVSEARCVTRLLDTVPMFRWAAAYAHQKLLPDELPVARTLQLWINFFDASYYPVENITWLFDKGVLALRQPVNTSIGWMVANLLWISSLACELAKNAVLTKHFSQREACQTDVHARHAMRLRKRRAILNLVKVTCDLIIAGHWLPAGILWAGKLSPTVFGLVGLIASILRLDDSWERLC